jgi:hypothetical protein
MLLGPNAGLMRTILYATVSGRGTTYMARLDAGTFAGSMFSYVTVSSRGTTFMARLGAGAFAGSMLSLGDAPRNWRAA